MIEAKGLTKCYGDFFAINAIDFSIDPGQIVGLVGLNGAGKTTLLKSLLGLTPYEGYLRILGLEPRRQRSTLMRRMCFIADVAILPRWLKVSNAIDFVEGVHPCFSRKKALGFIQRADVSLNKRVSELSKGMVVQLHLALVMAIDVDILVLDEPTLGLDILYRKRFYQTLIEDYYTANRTIIIATHQVEEVESMLTHLMMIRSGKKILDCPMTSFTERFECVCTQAQYVETLRGMSPLSESTQFGRTSFIFDHAQAMNLSLDRYGDVYVPSVSDVFVAKMEEVKEGVSE